MRATGWAGAILAGVWLWSSASAASAWTPVPRFPRDGRLAVAGVDDEFGALRAFLAARHSPVGAQYHVAIVAYSDPLDRPGPEYGDEDGHYIDAVVQAWAPRVDREQAVLIVLALRNRDIIVHPFSRWARLGWERDEVVRTIDASPFASFARAGDYGAAVQALIGSIERQLEARVARAEQELIETRERIATVRGRLATWDRSTAGRPFQMSGAQAARDEAEHALAGAETSLAEGRVHEAFIGSWTADSAIASAERQLTTLQMQAQSVRGRLPRWKARLERIDHRLTHGAGDLEEARAAADHARSEIGRAERALADGRVPDAAGAMDQADRWLVASRERADAAARWHGFLTRTLPVAIAVVVLLLLAWVMGRRWARTRRRRAEAERLVAEWEQKVGHAGENLLALQNDHPIVLGRPDLVQRFDGETAAPVREAARRVDDLFLAFDVAQRLAREGRAVLAARAMFSEAPYERVVQSLTTAEVVARTEDVRPRRLFLPEEREVRMAPPELLHEMDAAYDEAQRKVADLEQRFAAAWDGLDRARANLAAAETAQQAVAEQGVAAAPLREAAARGAATFAELHARGQHDPIGAAEAIGQLVAELAELRRRTEEIAGALRRVSGEVAAKRDAVVARVQSLRAGEGGRAGLALAEPGFEPEAMVAHAERAAGAVHAAAERGDAGAAEAEAAEAVETLAEIADLLDRSVRSRDESPGRIATESARLDSLRAALPERRGRIAALAEDHADAALQPALDNAQEAEPVLAQVGQCLAEARRCIDLSAQRWLAGAELIERATADLDAVEALYAEIEQKADELAATRRRAGEVWDAAAATLGDLARMTEGDAAFASAATLAERDRAAAALAAAREAGAGARPDWLALADEARRISEAALRAAGRARDERDAFDEAARVRPDLVARREGYGALLRGSEDDRAETNERYRDASAALDGALAMAGEPRPIWPDVLEALRDAERRLEECKGLAEKDFEEARAARAAIVAAEESIRRADTRYGYGIVASLDGARGPLRDAQQLLARATYAEALAAAHRARESAERAAREARVRVAEKEEEEREAERRRARVRAAARSSWSSGSSTRSSSFGASTRSSSFGSSTRSSSSSGRSSFGSSSGRSSFGRSSGRSKW